MLVGITIFACLFLLTHDSAFGVLQEFDDVLDFRAIRHLILNLVDDIEHAGLSVKQQTLGIGNMLLHLLVDTGKIHNLRVGATVFHGGATSDDVRRHVVRESTAGLYQ